MNINMLKTLMFGLVAMCVDLAHASVTTLWTWGTIQSCTPNGGIGTEVLLTPEEAASYYYSKSGSNIKSYSYTHAWGMDLSKNDEVLVTLTASVMNNTGWNVGWIPKSDTFTYPTTAVTAGNVTTTKLKNYISGGAFLTSSSSEFVFTVKCTGVGLVYKTYEICVNGIKKRTLSAKDGLFWTIVASNQGGTGSSVHTQIGYSLSAKKTASSDSLIRLTYDLCGGSGTISSASIKYGENLPSISVPIREGYDFLGFYDSSEGGTQYYDSSAQGIKTWDKCSDTTLYAHWAAKTYQVSYVSGKFGIGASQCSTKTHGIQISLKDAIFFRPGYSQTGWAKTDGSNFADYELCGLYTNELSTVLYPVWTAPAIKNVHAIQRYPWNGKVDISYTVEGDISTAAQGTFISLQVTARDTELDKNYTASKLSGDTSLAEGTHEIVWDLDDEGLSIVSSNIVVNVSYVTNAIPVIDDDGLYCVIDLSEGANATMYPVSYLDAVPAGGWTDSYKTTKLALRRVTQGTFTMGDQVHGGTSYANISLSKPFYIGVFEVTQRQWELVMGSRVSYFTNELYYAMRPVENVSYNMIRGEFEGSGWPTSASVDEYSFLGKLRRRTGLLFELPLEAQWEYACRAGTKTDYNNGTDYTNSSGEDAAMNIVGRYSENSGFMSLDFRANSDLSKGTAKVGSYEPNALGLYDMHGNVCELCLDWKGDLVASAVDPVGAYSGTSRIARGGGWARQASICTSFSRYTVKPESTGNIYGFRLSRTLR